MHNCTNPSQSTQLKQRQFIQMLHCRPTCIDICFFSATCRISMSRLCYEHDACPSVCNIGGLLSQCNKKWKSAYESIFRCLGYPHAEANPDRIILRSRILLRKTSGVWKNAEFCTSAAIISGSHVALSQHMLRTVSCFTSGEH